MAFKLDAQKREQRSQTQLLFALYVDHMVWDLYQQRKGSDAHQERWVGDFVAWRQQEAYQRAFHSLLDALQRT